MARQPSRYPTELELAILKILWKRGPLSVRDVQEQLRGFRKLAYTSVMTIMNIMSKKGYLSRSKQGKSFIYTPKVKQEKTASRMLGDVVERVFDGSAITAMVNLLKSVDGDLAGLKELRKLIDRKVKEEQK